MKHFVRILIAVLIVGLTGFGVWFFAFRDKPHEAVFKEMTAALDHLGEVTITYTYKSGSKDESASVTGYESIIAKYETVSNNRDANNTQITNLRNNIIDLYNYNAYTMEAIDYYYSLTATAQKVKNKDKKALVKAIDKYVAAVDSVVEVVDDSISFYYVKDASESDQVQGLLDKDVTLLKNMLAKEVAQTELYLELREYVDKYVFDGVVPDYRSAFYNIYINQLNIVCNEHWDNPNDDSASDKFTPDANFYNTANIFSTSGAATSLMGDIHSRSANLKDCNYMDNSREYVQFINSYVRVVSDISNILKVQSVDGTQNRLLFVSNNRTALDAIAEKVANGTTLTEDDNNTLKSIATAYKYEGVTSLEEAKLVDIYNVLNYICNA